jgi:hypothetical protein
MGPADPRRGIAAMRRPDRLHRLHLDDLAALGKRV